MAPPLGALILAAGILAGGAAIAGAWAADKSADPTVSLAEGAGLYQAHCAACHGANLEGEPNWRQRRPDGTLPAPPQDASGHTWHHPDQQLFEIVKQGTAALVGGDYKSNMRGFAGVLSDAEIRGVLGYIRSQWPAAIQKKQAEITARAGGHAH